MFFYLWASQKIKTLPKGIAKLLHQHQSPSLVLKYPRLIYLQFTAAWLTTIRFWHVSKHLKRIIARKGETGLDILDIGCSSGELIFPIIIRNPTMRFTGIDRNDKALETARIFKQSRKLENFEIEQGDIKTINTIKSYDVICAVSVLQYVDNVVEGLRGLNTILKPGGVMILYIPVNYKRIIPGYEYLIRNWFNDVDYNANVIANDLTEAKLKSAVKDAGLVIQEIHYAYGLAGKIAYEIISLGQLMIYKLPWLLAIVFGLIYFPIILIPAWLLMIIDLIKNHRKGNGLVLTVSG